MLPGLNALVCFQNPAHVPRNKHSSLNVVNHIVFSPM